MAELSPIDGDQLERKRYLGRVIVFLLDLLVIGCIVAAFVMFIELFADWSDFSYGVVSLLYILTFGSYYSLALAAGASVGTMISRKVAGILRGNQLVRTIDLGSRESWDTEDQRSAANHLLEITEKIRAARFSRPSSESDYNDALAKVAAWEDEIRDISGQLTAGATEVVGVATLDRTFLWRRQRRVDSLIQNIQNRLTEFHLQIAEPVIAAASLRNILSNNAVSGLAHQRVIDVTVANQVAYVQMFAPRNTVPTTIKEVRKTKKGTIVNDKARPAIDVRGEFAALIANSARHIVKVALNTVPGLNGVTLSLVQPTTHQTLGHGYNRCVLSVPVERMMWDKIVHPRVTSENALSNFDLRFRYDKRTFELQEVTAHASPTNVDGEHRTTVLPDMDPIEFEILVTDLLTAMGFQASTTRASGDGGVDVEAYNPEPIVGGKIVVQCKRYAGTIGSPIIRELYGAMMSRRATKGILITTSEFSPAARDFATDKPLELINGKQLVQLLRRHGFKVAEIV